MSKEYEIKTRMEQEQWLQLKMLFLLGGGGGILLGANLPHPPIRENPAN